MFRIVDQSARNSLVAMMSPEAQVCVIAVLVSQTRQIWDRFLSSSSEQLQCKDVL
jgi:hypothetical protein